MAVVAPAPRLLARLFRAASRCVAASPEVLWICRPMSTPVAGVDRERGARASSARSEATAVVALHCRTPSPPAVLKGVEGEYTVVLPLGSTVEPYVTEERDTFSAHAKAVRSATATSVEHATVALMSGQPRPTPRVVSPAVEVGEGELVKEPLAADGVALGEPEPELDPDAAAPDEGEAGEDETVDGEADDVAVIVPEAPDAEEDALDVGEPVEEDVAVEVAVIEAVALAEGFTPAQAGGTVSASSMKETPPLNANMRPVAVTPESSETDAEAITVPAITEKSPIVAEEPTCVGWR